MKAYVIHENEDWMPPLRAALDAVGVPYEEWFVDEGHFDVTSPPPEGVFVNRMSASSHTRGHTAAVEHTRQLLAWLERHDRRVLNGTRAFELEVSKAKQYAALQSAGLRTPATRVVAGGPEALLDAAAEVPTPFVTKHNRGGKGLGVRHFPTHDAFERAVREGELPMPPAHVTLLQQYVEPVGSSITRCEFVDGEYLYAVTADTSDGFELCPADACRPDTGPETSADDGLFARREDVPPALIERYARFLEREQIDVAGIEFIEDAEGRAWTYDVNTTTNYAPQVEAKRDRGGMAAVAELVDREVRRLAPAT